ncbi:hypothetical protein [Polymorphobacter sp.]|uniref:hypothetical protein n=1 Tax=Polymorphobacter sp. TaxID=1909290 RepID=UPI003F71CD03
MVALTAAVCIGTLPVAAFGQDGWRDGGKPIAGDPSMASSKSFAVFQIATLDGEGFAARWNMPTAGVEIAKTSKVARNQPVFIFIVFTGCTPDQSGTCNVTADFRMFDPVGKSFGEQLGSRVWVGAPPPTKYALQLSSEYLGMIVENKDSLGAYRIVATVTDHVSGISLTTEQKIIAEPAP